MLSVEGPDGASVALGRGVTVSLRLESGDEVEVEVQDGWETDGEVEDPEFDFDLIAMVAEGAHHLTDPVFGLLLVEVDSANVPQVTRLPEPVVITVVSGKPHPKMPVAPGISLDAFSIAAVLRRPSTKEGADRHLFLLYSRKGPGSFRAEP